MEILDYLFFQNALWGSLLASVACGIIGTYIVTRRLVFISGGITHASFGGVGIGMYLSLSPLLCALVFAVLTAFGVQWLGKQKEMREDSAIALFWTFGMAVGVIFCFLSPGYSNELSTYLFGNILTITGDDILLLSIVGIWLVLFHLFFLRTIILVAFDRDYALSRRVAVNFIEYAMMFFIALTIIASLRMVGIVLVISMLTIPQMTAQLFTKNYRQMIFCSIFFGLMANVIGLFASYWINIPSGATIILFSVLLYALCKGGKECRKHCTITDGLFHNKKAL